MNRKTIIFGAAVIALVAFPLTSSTYANLDGQIVSATFSNPADIFVGTPQFVSPVTIGPGVEFSTIWSNFDEDPPFVWNINVDFSDDSLTLWWTESTHGQGAAFSAPYPLLGIDLTFSQPILSNVSFSSFVTTGYWQNPLPMGDLFLLSNDASSIDVQFHGMSTGDIYTFDVATVPEPSSLLLAISGLSLIGLALRRRSSS